jgi:GDSL-like Lipase/Acylhydrolase family
MAHIVLLGDSIFDNAAYVHGGPAVIDHLHRILGSDHRATLLAVDGSLTSSVPRQVRSVPDDASHIVVSMGGNDALAHTEILDKPVKSTADALRLLSRVRQAFEASYREALTACLRKNLPVTLCTIYNGNFSDADYQQRATIALVVFNDTIVRIAREKNCSVIELRDVCTSADDYANPIEPSVKGGEKIARAIAGSVLAGAR